MSLKTVAESVGKGLFAGVAGTAAITASTMIEMKLREREPSDAPAEAAEKVLDIEPADEEARARLGQLMHWDYGIGWGIPRALLGAAGVKEPAASALHFAAVWGTALVMLPSLKIAPPPTKWGAKELVVDALNHAVYAVATGCAYEWLERS